MQLSIVSTLYRSSKYIDEFYMRISDEAKKITDDYEIILVDDGSPDDSLEKVINIFQKDSKLNIIELSRNFGHHKAIMTGLAHAEGEYIFLIDCDLEEEPELLGRFWVELQSNNDLDVVYGVQETRKGGWFERWSGSLFWKILNYLSEIKIPSNILTSRLMTKKYLKALNEYHESELFLGGLFYHNGFKQKEIIIMKHSNNESSYTLKKKLSLLVNSITSFSNKPLVYIFKFGSLITLISSFYIIKILIDKFFYKIPISGWASLIVSIWFFGGLIILFLGIIGIYLSKIFIETKRRPYSIIRNYYKETSRND